MNAPWFDVVWRILKRDYSLPEEMKAPPCLVRRLHNLSPPSLPAMMMICMLWDLLHPSLTIRLQKPSELRKKLPPLRTQQSHHTHEPEINYLSGDDSDTILAMSWSIQNPSQTCSWGYSHPSASDWWAIPVKHRHRDAMFVPEFDPAGLLRTSNIYGTSKN
jgi:hypothetical protein